MRHCCAERRTVLGALGIRRNSSAFSVRSVKSPAAFRSGRLKSRYLQHRLSFCALLLAWVLLFPAMPLAAPPFKTTDTGTAETGVLELRLGLIQFARQGSRNEVLSPLIRANYGLGSNLELVSEFEYDQSENTTGNAALGGKWRFLDGDGFSMGVEMLTLLPVRTGDSGPGIESQLLMTWRRGGNRLNFNVGGFHDPRGAATVDGWRASLLAEQRLDGFRHGVEVFARQKRGLQTDARLGYGFVQSFGSFDVRSGVHLGLTRQAPDVVFNFWVSREF